MKGAAKRILLEVLGWALVVLGIAALILPGPGLLMMAAGLVLLSQQYEWAERRVKPIQREALKGAARSVETWPRVLASATMVLLIVAAGLLWLTSPPAPDWWPVAESWWLPGGTGTAISQFASAAIAASLLVWSFRRFHGKPEAIEAVVTAAASDDDREHFWGD